MGATITCPNGRAAPDCPRKESLQLGRADAYQPIDRRLCVARARRRSPGNWLGRFVMLRLLGLVYLMAFLTLVYQGPALIGPHGLVPVDSYLDEVAAQARLARGRLPRAAVAVLARRRRRRAAGRRWIGARAARRRCWRATRTPSCSRCSARCRSRSPTSARRSTASAGRSSSSRPASSASSSARCSTGGRSRGGRRRAAVIWLLRWLAMRIMWGAGLIKLRGDACWRDLTCLDFHFETQPIPSPLSPCFHRLPHWAHAVGVAFNHVVELGAPFLIFGRAARVRFVGGALMAGAAGRPDRERQPVVSQLADAGARSSPASTTGSGGGFFRRGWWRARRRLSRSPRRRARRG